MSKMYEVKRESADPFDIMCSDCEIHYIECWEQVSEEELREDHLYDLGADSCIPENEKKVMAEEFGWTPAPEDFNEWLAQAIADGYVREVC